MRSAIDLDLLPQEIATGIEQPYELQLVGSHGVRERRDFVRALDWRDDETTANDVGAGGLHRSLAGREDPRLQACRDPDAEQPGCPRQPIERRRRAGPVFQNEPAIDVVEDP